LMQDDKQPACYRIAIADTWYKKKKRI